MFIWAESEKKYIYAEHIMKYTMMGELGLNLIMVFHNNSHNYYSIFIFLIWFVSYAPDSLIIMTLIISLAPNSYWTLLIYINSSV